MTSLSSPSACVSEWNYGITLLDGNLEQYGNESNVADLPVHIVSTALWVQVRVQLNTKAAGNWMFIPPIDKNRM
jgi:hypothetical protein